MLVSAVRAAARPGVDHGLMIEGHQAPARGGCKAEHEARAADVLCCSAPCNPEAASVHALLMHVCNALVQHSRNRRLLGEQAQTISPNHAGSRSSYGVCMQVGKRKTQVTILGGSVVRVWGALEGVLQRHEHSLSRSDRTMRAVHVSFPDGSLPLIGVLWPSDCQRRAVHVSLPDRPLPLMGVLWHSDCQRRAVHVSLPDWPLPLMGVLWHSDCQRRAVHVSLPDWPLPLMGVF